MPLTGKQRRHLRALGHHLDPVVQVGQAGVTDAVIHHTDSELTIHELIKVKVGESPDKRDEVAERLAAACRADVAQLMGKTILLYRPNREKPTIKLPKD